MGNLGGAVSIDITLHGRLFIIVALMPVLVEDGHLLCSLDWLRKRARTYHQPQTHPLIMPHPRRESETG